MKLVRSAVVLVVAAAAALVPIAPHADRYVAADATGDVVKYAQDGTTTAQPDGAEGDILRSGVRHRARGFGFGPRVYR